MRTGCKKPRYGIKVVLMSNERDGHACCLQMDGAEIQLGPWQKNSERARNEAFRLLNRLALDAYRPKDTIGETSGMA